MEIVIKKTLTVIIIYLPYSYDTFKSRISRPIDEHYHRRSNRRLMNKIFKLNGLSRIKQMERINKEIAALNGVDQVTVNFDTTEMIIEAESGKMPRIEYAAAVIIHTLEPGVKVQVI